MIETLLKALQFAWLSEKGKLKYFKIIQECLPENEQQRTFFKVLYEICERTMLVYLDKNASKAMPSISVKAKLGYNGKSLRSDISASLFIYK